MFSFKHSLALLAAMAAHTYAEDSLLCNADFSSANATSSVASMNFNTAEISIHSWAVTVASPSSNPSDSEVETSIWYDPGNADYANNTLLGYDLCAFFISDLPENTNRLAQGGAGCGGYVSQSCQDALRSRASAEALRQTKNVEDIRGGIPDICSSIASSFGDAEHTWPSECREAFGEGRDQDGGYVGATVNSMAITGYNTSGLTPDCKLHGAGKTFHRVNVLANPDLSYDEATRTSLPMLSVYMPVAQPQRRRSIGNVYTSLNCLRPDSFRGSSRVSPELPQWTPYASGAVRIVGGAGGVAGVLSAVVLASIMVLEAL